MKNSQNTQILKALKKGARITPMDALKRFGCFRLGARIADLKKPENKWLDYYHQMHSGMSVLLRKELEKGIAVWKKVETKCRTKADTFKEAK